MDSLIILLLSVLLCVGSGIYRLHVARQRVFMLTQDIDMLLQARVKRAMVLEQALRVLPSFPNPALVQALSDVSSLMVRQRKSLNERLIDEQRLSKLIVSVRECLAQPLEGAVFAQRDAAMVVMKEVDELEVSARAVLGMAAGVVQSYHILLRSFPYRVIAPALHYAPMTVPDVRL